MISAPTLVVHLRSTPPCQGTAPSRLCVMQDMAVLHRALRSLHPDLSTAPLCVRAQRPLCLTASLTPRRNWTNSRLPLALCGEPFVQPRVHPSDLAIAVNRKAVHQDLKIALSLVKGRRHNEHKAPRSLTDTRSRVASGLRGAVDLQL